MNQPLNLPLARSAVDRDYLARTRPELFDELKANPDTRVLAVHRGKVRLTGAVNHPNPALLLAPLDLVPDFEIWAYLGLTTEASEQQQIGSPVMLAVLSDEQALALEPNSDAWHVLRRTGAGLSNLNAGLYAQALALANWHATHQHCPKCGAKTTISQGGWVRICPNDNTNVFPRTDPAVIVAVIDEQDRLLMGSQGVWEENRWSVLAGFVEPGESLNAAVVREMFEEAGVQVGEPEYLGSQAWPFPYSLMMGFVARVQPNSNSHLLTPDGDEIEKLRWFSREELLAEAGQLLLPSRITIARALIEHWLGHPLVLEAEVNG